MSRQEVSVMVFIKHIKNDRNLNHNPENLCDECGTVIEHGSVYYSRRFKQNAHGPLRKPVHICEECFEKNHVVA
jgi:hypothetical protein